MGGSLERGRKLADYVTCKDQLLSDGQVPRCLTLTCY